MNSVEQNLIKRLLEKLIASPIAKADNIIYRTAKGLLMRLEKKEDIAP